MPEEDSGKVGNAHENAGELLEIDELETQTLNLANLLISDLSVSGSFNIQEEILGTALGRLLQVLPIPGMLIDQALQIVFANEASGRISASRESLPGSRFCRLASSPGNSAKLERILREAFTLRKPKVVETPLRTERVDELRWGRITLRSVRIMQSRFLLALIEDLTAERKRLTEAKEYQEALLRYQDLLEERVKERTLELSLLNEALSRSEEKFRLFMDNSPALAWIKDEQGRYTFLSSAFEKRFGVQTKNSIGTTDRDLWPNEIAESFIGNDKTVLLSGSPLHVVEDMIDKSGNRSSWSVTMFPLSDALGSKYVGGIGIDITERQRDEEARKQLLEALQAQMHQLKKDATFKLQATLEPLVKQLQLEVTSPAGQHLVSALERHLNQGIPSGEMSPSKLLSVLTPREMRACNLIVAGLTSKEMATAMGVTVDAISSYRFQIRRKLGLDTAAQSLGEWLQLLYHSG